MITKEGIFNKALVDYLIACIEEGDFALLRDIGIDRELQLRLAEGVSPRFLLGVRTVLLEQINLPALLSLLDAGLADKRVGSLQDELLRAQAPRTMMSELFNWSDHEYAKRRNRLGLPAVIGRPPNVPEEQQAYIDDAWTTAEETQGLTKDAENLLDRAKAYLAVSRITGADLRAIYRSDESSVSQGHAGSS